MTDLETGTISKEDPPPSYESAPKDEAPPSYESLYAKVKRTKEESKGPVDFTQNACKLCCAVVCGSVLGLVFLGLSTALPIAMIVIGGLYMDQCPVERYIPIYLVVGGSFGLFYFLMSLCNRARPKKEGEEEGSQPGCLSGFLGLVSCFTTAWFIAGNVWVYRTYGIYSPDSTAVNYCHQTLYLFAFWQITACYILLGAVIVLAICCCCLMLCFRKD